MIDLWESICEQIQQNLADESDDRIFRLLIPSFEMFLPPQPSRSQQTEIIRFLRNLKTLVRATNCVCLISADESLLPKFINANLISQADLVLKVTSFKDHQEMKIGDYDGTLRLLKLPKINGFINSPLPDSDIYALKLKSKSGITVEKIHLDPEEDRAG